MTAKTGAKRQSDYYKRQIARGLKLVSVWVRADRVAELREMVKRLAKG